jgi:hypothetical protein
MYDDWRRFALRKMFEITARSIRRLSPGSSSPHGVGQVPAKTYIMNDTHLIPGDMPTQCYLDGLERAYTDLELPLKSLTEAVQRAYERYQQLKESVKT